jgi:ABC transporter DrrB family efflux protein
MSIAVTAATARRVTTQLRRDPGTLVLLLVVPAGLMTLFRFLFVQTVFDRLGACLLGVFPFTIMFAVTAVTTLRERTAGTLERLLAMPAGKLDLLVGYAVTFGGIALVQAGLLVALSVGPLGLDLAGGTSLLVLVAVLDGLLGMALGLFVSVFARTEFQVGQLMPAFVLPQLLLSGVFGPRTDMAPVLHVISDALPLTYAVDAGQRLAAAEGLTGWIVRDLAVLAGAAVGALALGAATLRRHTP